MTNKANRDDLLNLAENVVDTILDMSIDEMQEDFGGEGIALEDAKKAFDSISDSAYQKVKRQTLAQSRAEMEANRKVIPIKITNGIKKAQAVVDQMAKGYQLTLAAQNARSDNMTDREKQYLAEDILELDADFHKAEDCG